MSAGYSGTPLPKKLGITGDAVYTLLHAPPGFEATLGDVGEAVRQQHLADTIGGEELGRSRHDHEIRCPNRAFLNAAHTGRGIEEDVIRSIFEEAADRLSDCRDRSVLGVQDGLGGHRLLIAR